MVSQVLQGTGSSKPLCCGHAHFLTINDGNLGKLTDDLSAIKYYFGGLKKDMEILHPYFSNPIVFIGPGIRVQLTRSTVRPQ